jgi:hypothetical protein
VQRQPVQHTVEGATEVRVGHSGSIREQVEGGGTDDRGAAVSEIVGLGAHGGCHAVPPLLERGGSGRDGECLRCPTVTLSAL